MRSIVLRVAVLSLLLLATVASADDCGRCVQEKDPGNPGYCEEGTTVCHTYWVYYNGTWVKMFTECWCE